MPLLDAAGVSKRFAGITALDSVTLDVDEGEAVGLIGPNGAGKTTFFNCLLGLLRTDGGTVEFDGRDLTNAPVYRRARAGIGRTFQRMELFAEMSVRDHLLVAERSRLGTGRFWKDVLNLSSPTAAEAERAAATLELLRLTDVADAPIEALSLGRGRLVEVGRALMTDPKLLLLDEPSSGLDGGETAALADTLGAVQAERGTAILLVEHDVEFVRTFVSRVFVLDFGTLIATGPTADVLASDEVRRARTSGRRCEGRRVGVSARFPVAYRAATLRRCAPPLRGGSGDVMTVERATVPPAGALRAEPLLELRSVDAGYGPFRALFDVSLAVRAGSVTALLGANGAGKTTVARVATGLVRPSGGEVRFEGEVVQQLKPFELARRGIVHAPEGRSVFASLTVRENLELSFRRALGRKGVEPALARAYELFPRLGERSKQVAGTLSGGEQRMLSLARVMVSPPKLLVADELSLGLAPIVVDEVYRNLAAIRDAGTAILLVEQYVAHALGLADDVVVLAKGAVAHAGPAAELGDIAQYVL